MLKKFNLSKQAKEIMLDALDCKQSTGKRESFEFTDGKGYIMQSRVKLFLINAREHLCRSFIS